MALIAEKTADPFHSRKIFPGKVGRHSMYERVRKRMDPGLGRIFAGFFGMVFQDVFNDGDRVGHAESNLDDILLGKVEKFDALH
jgi:hypothetical protein